VSPPGGGELTTFHPAQGQVPPSLDPKPDGTTRGFQSIGKTKLPNAATNLPPAFRSENTAW